MKTLVPICIYEMSYFMKYHKYKNKYINLKMLGGNILLPNLSLLRDHGTDGSFYQWKKKLNIYPLDEAFCLEFNSGIKTLYYIGTKHTTDIESNTYKYIKEIIINYKPDIVLIEGIPINLGLSPDLSHFIGEGKFAGDLAAQKNIIYSGIESNENEILLALSSIYKIEDIYGFIYLRMHKYYYKTIKTTKNEFNNDFQQYQMKRLGELFGKINWDPIKWFKQNFKKKFTYGRFLEYSSPYDNNEIITQKISYHYGKIRDTSNIKNLYKFINQYNVILFIMGQNHVYADINVLINSFGNYKILF